MEVGSLNQTRSTAYTAYAGTARQTASRDQAAAAAGASVGDAYDVSISDAAKNRTKGLTNDQIDALKSDVQKSYSVMIQTMTSHNAKLQNWLDQGIGSLRFGDVTLDASRFGIPNVATSPEEARAAIADGGEWSVNAVSDRIFGLASALANGDPDKLKEMQDAVEKGFKQAGMDFKKVTGRDDMPKITQDTHDEITRRFEELLQKLTEKDNPGAEEEAGTIL